jgi:hypothetical protein
MTSEHQARGKKLLPRPYIVNKGARTGPKGPHPSKEVRFLENERNKFANFSPTYGLIWRDVTREINMLQAFNRSRSTAAVPANAATSVENSSDERIAAGDKLAMQVLFARHRTRLYRWLFRFVGDETVAEDSSERCIL